MRIFGYGKSGRDPKLVVDACKFLELAVLLRLQDFNLYCLFVVFYFTAHGVSFRHEWIFLKDWQPQQGQEEGETMKAFTPFVYRFEKAGGATPNAALLSVPEEGVHIGRPTKVSR